MVCSIYDATEVAIKKMIEASKRMLIINIQGGGEGKDGRGMNPVMNKHLELEIKTLQNAPRDADKLEQAFESKGKTKGRSYANGGDTHRLATEIEMLKLTKVEVVEIFSILDGWVVTTSS